MTTDILPIDHSDARLVGRVWRDDARGPALVCVRDGQVVDISAHRYVIADRLDRDDALDLLANADGETLCDIETLLANSQQNPPQAPYLLAPCDVQAIKACGVTFAVSLLE